MIPSARRVKSNEPEAAQVTREAKSIRLIAAMQKSCMVSFLPNYSKCMRFNFDHRTCPSLSGEVILEWRLVQEVQEDKGFITFLQRFE